MSSETNVNGAAISCRGLLKHFGDVKAVGGSTSP